MSIAFVGAVMDVDEQAVEEALAAMREVNQTDDEEETDPPQEVELVGEGMEKP